MSTIKSKVREALKSIPSVDEILSNYNSLTIPVSFLKFHINKILKKIRYDFQNELFLDNPKSHIDNVILELYNKLNRKSLRPVINGTGIILHTGLGRAPISKEILIDGIVQNYPYSNLEFNLENGKRGDRNSHISDLISSICNTEESIVVNNNAAAVMLVLNAICCDKEVIISRGQQVEIGGSFRIPDVIEKSQSKMIEIGTTNKTHIKDYKDAISKKSSAILYVHTSNYKVIGFTNEVEIKDLSIIAKEHKIPLIVDLGSGSVIDFKFFGLPMEKMIMKYFDLGADIVTFSGDKLLGGPQSGIISGKKQLIDKIKNNSIYRTVRCDKIRISILENILRTYYSSKKVSDKNLSINLFLRTKDQLIKNAEKILKSLSPSIIKKLNINYIESNVEAGSGSLPTEKIHSIALSFNSKLISPNNIYKKFLNLEIPLVGYIKNDQFYIDLKAIPDDQINLLIKSIELISK